MSLISLEHYHRPQQLDEAIGLLATHGDDALIVGGGTFIHGLVARGLISNVTHLIDIRSLGLDYIRPGDAKLTIGATTSFRQLEENSNISSELSLAAIRDALAYPPAQIKNAATLGGCVASSCPFLDLPISLLALNATAIARGREGERRIQLEEFFISLFDNCLVEGEILQALEIPLASPQTASAFEKLETNANDLAILNAAVSITVKGKSCQDIRIFVGGGVGEVPIRATSAEAALTGLELDAEHINHAAACAKEDVDPLSDHRASARYRLAMTEVLIRRCLNKSIERLGIN